MSALSRPTAVGSSRVNAEAIFTLKAWLGQSAVAKDLAVDRHSERRTQYERWKIELIGF